MNIAVVDTRLSEEAERKLSLYGFEVIRLPRCSSLGEAIASHPDSLLFRCKDDILSSADYCDEASYVFTDIRERVKDIRFQFCSDTLGERFPADCLFNALVMGRYLFCREDTVSKSVIRIALEHGLEVVNVRQAYPACSTLALGDKAAICADEGLSHSLEKKGIKVYRIEPGHIALPPYEYGFIGGACGVFKDKIYFFGDYKLHPSAEIIERAAGDFGYTPVSLGSGGLCDLGGVLFIEKEA